MKTSKDTREGPAVYVTLRDRGSSKRYSTTIYEEFDRVLDVFQSVVAAEVAKRESDTAAGE